MALASLIVFLAVLVSWESVGDRAGGFYGWLFLLQAATIGAFLSFDLLLFYVFFELTLIPSFFLIGSWGVGSGPPRRGPKFFLYTLLGSLFTLVGMIGIAIVNPTPLSEKGERVHAGSGEARMPTKGAITFSIPELMENVQVWDEAHQAAVNRSRVMLEKSPANPELVKGLEAAQAAQHSRRSLASWLFVALLAGFAVKLPIVPFHTWLPSAYSEAPLAITMFLAAVLGKLGAFGILRIVLPLTPEPSVTIGLTTFGTLGAIGIVYAALCAFAQKDLKLLAAYSSVSHLGFLVLGLFALTPESLTGATLHMVNHGLTAGATFALLGFLADRYRTLDMNHYGGLWARFPKFTFFFIVIALASVGLPGLNNFVSEMLMLAGLFDPRNLAAAGRGIGDEGFGLAVAAAGGIFLSAWYTLHGDSPRLLRTGEGTIHEIGSEGHQRPRVPSRSACWWHSAWRSDFTRSRSLTRCERMSIESRNPPTPPARGFIRASARRRRFANRKNIRHSRKPKPRRRNRCHDDLRRQTDAGRTHRQPEAGAAGACAGRLCRTPILPGNGCPRPRPELDARPLRPAHRHRPGDRALTGLKPAFTKAFATSRRSCRGRSRRSCAGSFSASALCCFYLSTKEATTGIAGEYYGCLFVALAGGSLLGRVNDLVTLFVGAGDDQHSDLRDAVPAAAAAGPGRKRPRSIFCSACSRPPSCCSASATSTASAGSDEHLAPWSIR